MYLSALSSSSPVSGYLVWYPFYSSFQRVFFFPVRWTSRWKYTTTSVLSRAPFRRDTLSLFAVSTQNIIRPKGSNETGQLPFSPSLSLSLFVCGVFLPLCRFVSRWITKPSNLPRPTLLLLLFVVSTVCLIEFWCDAYLLCFETSTDFLTKGTRTAARHRFA